MERKQKAEDSQEGQRVAPPAPKSSMDAATVPTSVDNQQGSSFQKHQRAATEKRELRPLVEERDEPAMLIMEEAELEGEVFMQIEQLNPEMNMTDDESKQQEGTPPFTPHRAEAKEECNLTESGGELSENGQSEQ